MLGESIPQQIIGASVLLDVDATLGRHEDDDFARLRVEHQADVALMATCGLLQPALLNAMPADPGANEAPERLAQLGLGFHPNDPAGLAAASHRYLRFDKTRETDCRCGSGACNKHALWHRHSKLAKQHLGVML